MPSMSHRRTGGAAIVAVAALAPFRFVMKWEFSNARELLTRLFL